MVDYLGGLLSLSRFWRLYYSLFIWKALRCRSFGGYVVPHCTGGFDVRMFWRLRHIHSTRRTFIEQHTFIVDRTRNQLHSLLQLPKANTHTPLTQVHLQSKLNWIQQFLVMNTMITIGHHGSQSETFGNNPGRSSACGTSIDASSEVGRSLPSGRQLRQARGGQCAAAEE